jgi:hypothetical protein
LVFHRIIFLHILPISATSFSKILVKNIIFVEQRVPLNNILYSRVACDTVVTGLGWNDRTVGRVSVVDGQGRLLLERFVGPVKPVTDYMTDVTGIRHISFTC